MSQDREVVRLADQLKRSVEGEAWHGPSILEILNGVTALEACARPVAGAHTIREILLHVSAWQGEALRTIAGSLYRSLAGEEDWPVVSDKLDSAWNDAIGAFRDGYAQLISAVRSLPEEKLEEVVLGRDFTFYFLLHGIVQHNLYHAGQMALLKRAARAEEPGSQINVG